MTNHPPATSNTLGRLVSLAFLAIATITAAAAANANGPHRHHASIYGFVASDPHVNPWGGGAQFEFPGLGDDYVLFQNPDYADGLGMEIQIRTQANGWWSFIRAAVLRIGSATIEVMGNDGDSAARFWVNGEERFIGIGAGDHHQAMNDDDGDGGDDHAEGIIRQLDIRKLNSKQYRFQAKIGGGDDDDNSTGDVVVRFETFQDFVRVDIYTQNYDGSFASSCFGLMGSFPEGIKIGRDKTTILEDDDEFAKEWRVSAASEDNLFHHNDGGERGTGSSKSRAIA